MCLGSPQSSYKSDEDSDSTEREYTNTITSLIELPSKQSATLKRMTRPKAGGKAVPTRQSSLSNLTALFKNRRISKDGYSKEGPDLDETTEEENPEYEQHEY